VEPDLTQKIRGALRASKYEEALEKLQEWVLLLKEEIGDPVLFEHVIIYWLREIGFRGVILAFLTFYFCTLNKNPSLDIWPKKQIIWTDFVFPSLLASGFFFLQNEGKILPGPRFPIPENALTKYLVEAQKQAVAQIPLDLSPFEKSLLQSEGESKEESKKGIQASWVLYF